MHFYCLFKLYFKTTLVVVREFVHKRILGVPEGEKLSSRDASFIGSKINYLLWCLILVS